jgi:hypothetical protein
LTRKPCELGLCTVHREEECQHLSWIRASFKQPKFLADELVIWQVVQSVRATTVVNIAAAYTKIARERTNSAYIVYAAFHVGERYCRYLMAR